MAEEYIKGSGKGKGGWRGGGRPKDVKTERIYTFSKRVTKEESDKLTEYLNSLRQS